MRSKYSVQTLFNHLIEFRVLFFLLLNIPKKNKTNQFENKKTKFDTTCTRLSVCMCDRSFYINYASLYHLLLIRLLIQTLHLISVNCFFTCHSCVLLFISLFFVFSSVLFFSFSFPIFGMYIIHDVID